MTALFVVIFVEQWKSFKSHIPVYAGVICSVICILIFGADNFILPSLILTVGSLIALRGFIEQDDSKREAVGACR